MIYADETYYNSEYLAGKQAVITAAYTYYFREASRILDALTFGNIKEDNVTDNVRMCCCELAESLYTSDKEQAKSAGKTSESVQGWSVSYASQADQQASLNGKVGDIVTKWLSGSGLLFSGVR